MYSFWLENIESMPKVRNSSGAIGTMRGPMFGSLMRSLSWRTSAIVVATDCLPEPCLSSAYALSPGSVSGSARTTRLGSEPPSFLRRSSMYSISGASAPGWNSGAMPVRS